MSHELALRFASKCYTHLEIAHFKDNYKSLADHQDDVEYWKEETLCRFLSLPDGIRAGSVVYAMITYLGAFPFPSLAPCIVTRESMLKVITLLTGRYRKILKRGDHDKNKLLFRSLAVFDRRSSMPISPVITRDQTQPEEAGVFNRRELQTAATGFSIDQPIDDEEDEDDDDLALAALDALDAIEVFKEDHKQDRKIHHAHIPVYNFERLVMLMLLFAPLAAQDNTAETCGLVDEVQLGRLENAAKALIKAFEPHQEMIGYTSFVQAMTGLTPFLFRPLNPLFEHFLYSKAMNVNKHQTPTTSFTGHTSQHSPFADVDNRSSAILNMTLLAQLSVSINITPTTATTSSSFFHAGLRLNQLYSTEQHGTSLSSFERQVLSWRSGSIIILKGTHTISNERHVIGAFLPDHWHNAGSVEEKDPGEVRAVMFQLQPRHAIFRANPYNKTIPNSHFSTKAGISLGCVIPPSSRINAASNKPILGPVSLITDEDMAVATFQHDGNAGTGAFLTDPLLESSQAKSSAQAKKIDIDIDALEVWGVSFPEAGQEDEVEKQKKRLAWEEAEAARRRGVNFGGDKDAARHLLEVAGIIDNGNRTGGSMG